VWVDYDNPFEVFLKKIEGIPKPSAVVRTGRGCHAYWLLNTPAKKGDIEKIERITKGLAVNLGADVAATDGARLLRLPGTRNTKVDRTAYVVWMKDLFYDLENFESYISSPEMPERERESKNPAGWQNTILDGVGEGERNSSLTRLAGRWFAKGHSKEEILFFAEVWANKCQPPLPRGELIKIVESIEKTHTNSEKAIAPVLDIHFTDMGNTDFLINMHGENVHYCHLWEKWMIWDGRRWKKSEDKHIIEAAKTVPKELYRRAGDESVGDSKFRKVLAEHAIASESRAKISNMVELARSDKRISTIPDDYDSDLWLLNCLNGTIDLKTGQLRPHSRKDLITKIVNVRYDPNATCPLFENFLDCIMNTNPRLIKYLQRAVGYSLTGDTREQCFFFLYGTGANGKSTFLETVKGLLADYADTTDFSTFFVRHNETVRNDLAKLFGVRLVTAIEMESGKRLSEVLVKQLTGGDSITARFLFREYFQYRPTFKIFLAANHKPEIWGTDHAIWRRIRLIPFAVTIPRGEQDKELPDKLRSEFPGILLWAVKGCLDWLENTMGDPREVLEATEEYREEMDILAGFIGECCILGPIDKIKIQAKNLYSAYLNWADTNKEKPLSQKTFAMRLIERGGITRRKGAPVFYKGIGLKDEGDR
jgi:putative DNA primase/helicase